MMIKTVGELRELLEKYPDDLVIGAYSGQNSIDYMSIEVYVDDRDEPDEESPEYAELVEWWGGEPPKKVLVFNSDRRG